MYLALGNSKPRTRGATGGSRGVSRGYTWERSTYLSAPTTRTVGKHHEWWIGQRRLRLPHPFEDVIAVGRGVGPLIEPARQVERRQGQGPQREEARAGLGEPAGGRREVLEVLRDGVTGQLPASAGRGLDRGEVLVDRLADDQVPVAADAGRPA